MLVKIKIVKGDEISLNVLETATIAELKDEISNFLSHPASQIKVLKPSGGVVLASARVIDVYSPPNPLKIILGSELTPKSDKVSLKIKFLNKLADNFDLSLPSDTPISSLKEKVSDFCNLNKSSLTFLHNGLVLSKQNITLKESNIRSGATIIVKQLKHVKNLTINVSAENSVEFQLSLAHTSTLSELRKMIASKLQKDFSSVRLMKSDIPLTDDNTCLRDYNIEDGQTISVLFNVISPNTDLLNQLSPCAAVENSPNEFNNPFFQELGNVLTKHIPDEQDRMKVMEHFHSHTWAYVNSLNLEDIQEIASSNKLDN